MRFGKGNVQGEHWQIFYKDGSNSGYFAGKNNNGRFGADDAPQKLQQKYKLHPNAKLRGSDDYKMKKAEAAVQKKWKREGRKYDHPLNDCHTYVIEVLEQYHKMK